ncbi:MAG: addiction module protein [Acidobacteriota bacterium]
MSESARPIIERFRKLPATEKITIVQQLWDDIADEAAKMPLTEAQRRLLDERIDEHEANAGDLEPWEEARDEILRRL